MSEHISIVVIGPLVLAAVCFVASLYHAIRMFSDMREPGKFVAYLGGPLALFSSSFYGTRGRVHFNYFQRWLRRFAFWLCAWALVALTASFASRI